MHGPGTFDTQKQLPVEEIRNNSETIYLYRNFSLNYLESEFLAILLEN